MSIVGGGDVSYNGAMLVNGSLSINTNFPVPKIESNELRMMFKDNKNKDDEYFDLGHEFNTGCYLITQHYTETEGIKVKQYQSYCYIHVDEINKKVAQHVTINRF